MLIPDQGEIRVTIPICEILLFVFLTPCEKWMKPYCSCTGANWKLKFGSFQSIE